MKYFLSVIYSLLISLVLGVVTGSIPFIWLYVAERGKQPKDAIDDFIFFVVPLGVLIFLGVKAVSFVLMLIFFLWRASKKATKQETYSETKE